MTQTQTRKPATADTVSSAVTSASYGATSAASVATAHASRSVRKAATSAGRAARDAASDAGSTAGATAQSLANSARSVAGASKARDTRKATTAAGRSAGGGAGAVGKGFSFTRAAPMHAVPKAAHQPPGAESRTAKTVTPRSATSQSPSKPATPGRARDAAGRFAAAAKDTARGVSQGATTGQKFARGMAVANPALLGLSGLAAASGAYNAAREAGSGKTEAAIAAATAAAPSAVAAAAPSLLGRFAPKVAAGLSKAALPLTAASAAVGAVRGGYDAYREGKGTAAIAGRAALGAADALTFGLASKAYDKVTGSSSGARSTPHSEDHPTGIPARKETIATAVGSGKANKLASVPQKPKPGAGPRQNDDQKKTAEPLPRSSYTNIQGLSKPHTKAEIAAYEKRKLLGATSGPEKMKKAG